MNIYVQKKKDGVTHIILKSQNFEHNSFGRIGNNQYLCRR
jgi:hypothetical protein